MNDICLSGLNSSIPSVSGIPFFILFYKCLIPSGLSKSKKHEHRKHIRNSQ